MAVYDVIMLTVLGAATIYGAWKGLVWQLASIASIVLSYYVALQLRQPVSEAINAPAPWNVFLAMLLLYIGTSLGVWLVFNIVGEFIDRLKLKEFDRQIGAIVGFAKGGLLCILITMFSVTLLGEESREQIVRSYSGYYIAIALHKADRIMPAEMDEVVGPYLDRVGEQLAQPHDENDTAQQPQQGGAKWPLSIHGEP